LLENVFLKVDRVDIRRVAFTSQTTGCGSVSHRRQLNPKLKNESVGPMRMDSNFCSERLLQIFDCDISLYAIFGVFPYSSNKIVGTPVIMHPHFLHFIIALSPRT